MAFITPIASFHPDHTAPGTAPPCVIRVVIQCHTDDCPDGTFSVRVEDAESSEVLARGRVRCTGEDESHDLDMVVRRPLTNARARLVFECGEVEQRSLTNMIWLQCSE